MGIQTRNEAPELRLVRPEKIESTVPRNLFLNSYSDMAFTKCPRCKNKTKVRKFPLVIHIDPMQLFILNKSCRLCEGCSLLVVRQEELENLMETAFEKRDPDIIGNDYLVIGTLSRKLWRKREELAMSPTELLEQTNIFDDQWQFEVRGGWSL